MNRSDIGLALCEVHEARETWTKAHAEFTVGVDTLMRRLLHEAVANRMGADEVARLSGYTVKRVRILMRTYGLDPKAGKTVLSRLASEALTNNAELLGIEPKEMDLMSPLAYLPAGSELRARMAEDRTARVNEDAFLETPKADVTTRLREIIDTGDDLIAHGAVLRSDFEGLLGELRALVARG